jgi:hypothetical protein
MIISMDWESFTAKLHRKNGKNPWFPVDQWEKSMEKDGENGKKMGFSQLNQSIDHQ